MRDILNEIVSVEIVNGNLTIEVNILRQKHKYISKNKDFIYYIGRQIY